MSTLFRRGSSVAMYNTKVVGAMESLNSQQGGDVSVNFTITILLLIPTWILAVALYRLYFHPLAGFPGPKVVAVTRWQEFYQDAVKAGGGHYYKSIMRMHKRYGPIVRISPSELHISDPEYYQILFAGGGEVRDKYERAAYMVGTTKGVFSTAEYHLHRRRKMVLNPFFSKQAVRAKEDLLWEKVEQLCQALEAQKLQNRDQAVDLRMSLLAFATDFFTIYGIGGAPHPELLPDLDRQAAWVKVFNAIEDLTPLVKQLPWIVSIASMLPMWFVKLLSPDLARLYALRQGMCEVARAEIQLTKKDDKIETRSEHAPNIYQAILRSNLPPQEKSLDRLDEEGFEVLAASADTLSRVTSIGIFHILANPYVISRLRKELDSSLLQTEGAARPSLNALENLPYLTACIRESLRIAAVVASRLPLVAPGKSLRYKNFIIPAGTPVSMTPSEILHDPRCFSEPETFKPERWLGEDGMQVPPDKYFVAFSKGNRMCPGMNIAWAEMYACFATLVKRYDMHLFDTVRARDVDWCRDCFLGKPAVGSKGVRVRISRRVDQRAG